MTSDAGRLCVEGVSVHYGRHAALTDLTLSAEPGELIAVIGPNGAGKTTFIKALSGQVPHGGTFRIGDHVLKKGADRRKHLGLVPQDIGLYAHLTARENLMVMARMMAISGRDVEPSVDWALDAVGLSAKADHRLSALSGGMKRRINVAAAIMHKPKVLIFDEPTAGVDIPARNVVHKLAQSLAAKNMIVLLITHELEQAEALSDKILLLKEGRVIGFDAPQSMMTRYFGQEKDVSVRFHTRPQRSVIEAMANLGFSKGHHDTLFVTRTATEAGQLSRALDAVLGDIDESVREIVIRRPGLETLLHDLQRKPLSTPDNDAIAVTHAASTSRNAS